MKLKRKTTPTMKLIKLIFISTCLSVAIQLSAQDLNPDEIFYGLELMPLSTQGDTLASNQVVVVLDTSDLELLQTITVESSVKIKELKVSKEERKDNPRIKLKDRNYYLDMQEWSLDEALSVKAKKLDGSKIELKKHPRGSEYSHKVDNQEPRTWDVKRSEGPGIVEDENEN